MFSALVALAVFLSTVLARSFRATKQGKGTASPVLASHSFFGHPRPLLSLSFRANFFYPLSPSSLVTPSRCSSCLSRPLSSGPSKPFFFSPSEPFSLSHSEHFSFGPSEPLSPGHSEPFSFSHSEPRSGEESPRLLRRRHDDLAGTTLIGHSEPRSGEESQRLLHQVNKRGSQGPLVRRCEG